MAKPLKKTVKKKEPKKVVQKIKCVSCNKYKNSIYFFKSYSESPDSTGYTKYCKECLAGMCVDANGKINKKNFLSVLRNLDRPYVADYWKKCRTLEPSKFLGMYLRKLAMSRYQGCKWMDGELDRLSEEDSEMNPDLSDIRDVQPVQTESEKFKKFRVTDDIIKQFGMGFTDEEYFYMKNKYDFLSVNYSEQTSMHTEALITYIRYKVKEEMAIANNKASEAKTWGDLAMKQAERAKINPNQFSKADLQGGLTTIGEIAQAVEQNVDIIPVLPQFKYRPNDAVDFCIWNYINYARDLEGKPLVEYSDIYKFYDKAKEDYIQASGDPYGIFKDDPTRSNREKVEQFIQLPDEYYEGEGDK